jgi:polyhydroxyalkanoate synthesis regulator phasin
MLLIELIQKGDQLFDTVKKSISSGMDLLTDAEGTLEKNIRKLVSRGELAAEEGDNLIKRLADWVKEGHSGLEGQIDQRVRQLARRLDIPAHDDVDRLHASIDRLSEAVERLQARTGGTKTDTQRSGGGH